MIRSLFQRRQAPFPPVAPDRPFTAVGDLHGRFDLLERAFHATSGLLVFVGDYVDRGDHSAAVLRHLHDRPDTICLMGNHEDMMLKFLADPERNGPRWLRYGGLQTLASFGVAGLSESAGPEVLRDARDALRAGMGDDLMNWLSALPTSWTSGNVTVVHAGADPNLPMESQEASTLKWGHADFRRTPRADGVWVVHGHTIVDQATAENGVISIDTGAYATGQLTLAHIDQSGVEFAVA